MAMSANRLRGPLLDVLDQLDRLLGSKEALSTRQRALAKRARENAAHMRDIVDDALEAARFQQGRWRPRPSEQDMRSLIRHAIERNEFLAAEKSISLVSEFPETAVPVLIDRRMALQLLSHLISNAINFSNRNGNIRVGTRRNKGGVEGWVVDQGQGMSFEDIPRLFQKFSRTDARATAGERGAGWGLFIVAEVLRLHHGTIRVTTEPGKGSNFTFQLPRKPRRGRPRARRS